MTTPTAIFDKYAQALIDLGMGEDAPIHADAILLALRLAIGDAYAAANGDAYTAANGANQAKPTRDQRQAESQAAQIERLNEWLETHQLDLYFSPNYDTAGAILAALADRDQRIDELRQRLAQLDADNAGLLKRLGEAQEEIDRLSRQNTIATDTFNALVAMGHAGQQNTMATDTFNALVAMGHAGQHNTNGAGPAASAGDWRAGLDDETNDWRISLEAGRRTFRQIPKHARLLLAQAFARHVGGGSLPKQAEFDERRPAWMPTATGLVSTFGGTWAEFLAINPATVAP